MFALTLRLRTLGSVPQGGHCIIFNEQHVLLSFDLLFVTLDLRVLYSRVGLGVKIEDMIT